jgi:hypothetical protein
MPPRKIQEAAREEDGVYQPVQSFRSRNQIKQWQQQVELDFDHQAPPGAAEWPQYSHFEVPEKQSLHDGGEMRVVDAADQNCENVHRQDAKCPVFKEGGR